MKIKTDSLMKLSLVFCIAVLSFAVGTFVGKQYSDQQHKIASMEPTKVEESHDVAATETAADDETKPMTDDELAKLSAEFIADDEVSNKNEVAEHGETHADEHATETRAVAGKAPAHAAPAAGHGAASAGHGAAVADTHGTVAAEMKAAHAAEKSHAPAGQKPVAKVENKPGQAVAVEHAAPVAKNTHSEDRLPSSVPKNLAPYSIGKFTVQLASFNSEEEARKKAQELKGRGFSAFYVPAEISGKTWFRVSVGLFSTEKEAKDYRQELMDKGEAKSALVQKVLK
ncbi:MAG: SPOR domain-containing protein [Bdellovibrionota bacterium]